MYHMRRPNVPKMKAPHTHIGVSLYYSFSQSLIDEAINTFVQVDWRARPHRCAPAISSNNLSQSLGPETEPGAGG